MTYHIIASHSVVTTNTVERDEWEIAALLSGANVSQALISRTFIDERDICDEPNINQIRGSQGHVIRKLYRQESVAEKKIGQLSNETEFRNFWSQVAIAEFLRDSQYIAKLRGIALKGDCYYVYFNWAEEGDLYSYLVKHETIRWEIKVKLAYEISCALSYCHEKNILHHQFLRPSLTNFRQSRPSIAQKSWSYKLSQEILRFGMLMYEIASQKVPFSNEGPLAASKKIASRERPFINKADIPYDDYYNIMIQSWDHDSQKRPTMSLISKNLYNLYSLIKKSCGPLTLATHTGNFTLEMQTNNNSTIEECSFKSHNENVTYEMQTNNNSTVKKVSDEDFAYDMNQAEFFHAQELFSKAFPIFEKFAREGIVMHATFSPVARNGHAEAQYITAMIYHKKYKENMKENSYIKLHKEFLDMAVKQNHAGALYICGQYYFLGEFYEKNMENGRDMLRAAHNLNHKDAATTLQQLEQENGQDITTELNNDAIVNQGENVATEQGNNLIVKLQEYEKQDSITKLQKFENHESHKTFYNLYDSR
ncbi:26072_t:CDS:2 [Dentiscutata erythropus]|uniref:26072_t:CDS:1 n=1 Tax=Dentiscutata erythropus TaxID=1348616 RepID=A0A9N9EI31_9GLOM|nr:26072_t:CDS:2 [Dentiscutata erythropus]